MKLRDITARHTKINKIEKLKQTRSYKEAWEALNLYSKKGYESISKDDLSYFLKCFGIFDRPSTPKRFMMRVRVPAGRLTPTQAKTIGEVAKEFGEDYIDLTTRMQIQLRHLKIEDIPTVIKRLEDVGVSSWQTGVDNFRNIVSDPLDGVAFDSIIEAAPLIKRMQEIWFKKEEWIATLPRKFNTSISGTMTNRCNLFAHDCCFVLANRDGEFGFNLYLGGKVGAIAKSADIFVREDEVIELYEAVIRLYKEFGFRDSRNKNRLYYLIQEAGMDLIRRGIEEVAGREFDRAGVTMVKSKRTEEVDGKIRLKNGKFALHMVVPSGVFSGSAMVESSKVTEEFGEALNISTTQNLYILGVKEEDIQKALTQKPFDRYKNISSSYFNQMVACAGVDLCPFGVIPNKSDAIEMAEFLEKEAPLPNDSSIRMHWSGCVKGCGVHELGDIGFVGCKVKIDGKSEYGVHIQLGGKSTQSQEEAYTILKSIPLKSAKYYVAKLAKAYRDLRKNRESFEEFESRVFRRYSKGAIEFILRWSIEQSLGELEFEKRWEPKSETDEIFTIGIELYKILSGQKPYQGIKDYNPIEITPPVELIKLNKTIPKGLSDIVMKMIAPKPKRYEVWSEILVELKKLQEPKAL